MEMTKLLQKPAEEMRHGVMKRHACVDFKTVLFGVTLCAIVAGGCVSTDTYMVDITKTSPEIWYTNSDFIRYDYFDESHRGENYPIASGYFLGSGGSVDPFKDIKVGMSKSEVVHILGEPLLDHDDIPYGYMWYRRLRAAVEMKYDHEGKIVSIKGGGF